MKKKACPNNLFRIMLQDHEGLIWMGGTDGLARFDGYSFMAFRHDHLDTNSISGNTISTMYEDSKGRLWIAAIGTGINVSNDHKTKFHSIKVTSDPGKESKLHVTDITEDASGNIWLATNTGLILVQEQNGSFSFSFDYPWLSYNASCKLNSRPTYLFSGINGQLWIGTESGLFMFDPSQHKLHCPDEFIGIPATPIHDISYDREGKLWVGIGGTAPRLYYGQGGTFQFRAFDKMLMKSSARPLKFTFDLDNRLWASEFGGELVGFDFRDSTLFLQSKVNSNLSDERFLHPPFVDHSGDVWVACEGFYIYRFPKGFNHYEHPFSFHQSSTCIYEEDNKLWLAYREQGMVRLNKITGQTDLFATEANPAFRLPVNHIQKIRKVKSGNKIIVGFNNISIMNPDDRVINNFPLNGTNRSILEDSKNRIWIGGYKGLHLFSEDAGVIATYKLHGEKKDSANIIQATAEDASGNIWFGSDILGLGKLNPVTGRNYPVSSKGR
jgi:ligand-binding sensor domain-containing protein